MLDPANHVVAENDEEEHGRDLMGVDYVRIKSLGFVPVVLTSHSGTLLGLW